MEDITTAGSSRKFKRYRYFILCLMIALTLNLGACSGGEAPSTDEQLSIESDMPQNAEIPGDEGEDEAPLGEEQLQVLWQGSAHADTYVLDESEKNSTCARCHAPVNWLPSMDDMPESCMACKFEVDAPPPVIPETEWTHVECKVCHAYKKDKVQPEVVWLEIAAIEEYAEVGSSTELCEKCHLAGDIESHVSVVVGGDHAGYACVDCHDAHSNQASCSNEGCHPVLMDGSDGIAGHDEEHTLVSCGACHDGSGMNVQPDSETNVWDTVLADSEVPLSSHATQLVVDCARCHFAANPWGLSEESTP